MIITQLASPAEHRAAASRAAAAYTQMVAGSLANPVIATSAQHAADMHRVLTALWSKAAVTMDPESAFFRLASLATATATAVPAPMNVRPATLIAGVRRAWSNALADMNIPLVFPAVQIPATIDVPDWAGARTRYLHNMTPQEYVTARLQQATQLGGASGLLAGLDAYLVDAAVSTGDDAFLTVYARWAWLVSRVQADTPLDAAQAIARDVLGVVESVRASEYVEL